MTPILRKVLLSGVTAIGPGAPASDSNKPPSFSGFVAGTGAVSATVAIEVRNSIDGEWVLYGTLTMTGTTRAGDAIGGLARYAEYRARVTAISGTGAAVTVTMGA